MRIACALLGGLVAASIFSFFFLLTSDWIGPDAWRSAINARSGEAFLLAWVALASFAYRAGTTRQACGRLFMSVAVVAATALMVSMLVWLVSDCRGWPCYPGTSGPSMLFGVMLFSGLPLAVVSAAIGAYLLWQPRRRRHGATETTGWGPE